MRNTELQWAHLQRGKVIHMCAQIKFEGARTAIEPGYKLQRPSTLQDVDMTIQQHQYIISNPIWNCNLLHYLGS